MRQFITRKAVNKTMLQKLKETLDEYFYYRKAIKLGIPTVQCIARQLNLFPSYSSDILRPVTGQNARQQIHNKPIEKAKEILSASDL